MVLIEILMEHAGTGNPAAIKEISNVSTGRVRDNVQLDIQLMAIRKMTDQELETVVAGAGRSICSRSLLP